MPISEYTLHFVLKCIRTFQNFCWVKRRKTPYTRQYTPGSAHTAVPDGSSDKEIMESPQRTQAAQGLQLTRGYISKRTACPRQQVLHSSTVWREGAGFWSISLPPRAPVWAVGGRGRGVLGMLRVGVGTWGALWPCQPAWPPGHAQHAGGVSTSRRR